MSHMFAGRRCASAVLPILVATLPLTGMAISSDVSAQGVKTMQRGIGVSTCSEFSKEYSIESKNAELMYFSWAQGYMSGMNAASVVVEHAYMDLSGEITTQELYLREYCHNHPLAYFADAVADLYARLTPKSSTLRR